MAKETNPPAGGDSGQALMGWLVPEFMKHQRGGYWYLLAVLVGLGILAYSIFTGNFFLIVITVLTVIILFVYHRQEPAMVNFAITEEGLAIGQKFYPYKEINKFWLAYEKAGAKTLFIDFKGIIRPHLDVPLMDQDPLTVRETLLKYLEEDLDQETEPLLDSLSRFLKL
ncbi:MAG: hypothetical protein V1684_02915 [bacterium]